MNKWNNFLEIQSVVLGLFLATLLTFSISNGILHKYAALQVEIKPQLCLVWDVKHLIIQSENN